MRRSAQARLVQALEQCTNVPLDRVRVVVCTGWVTLEGAVNRYDQCEDAEEVVRDLIGLAGVTNLIMVKPTVAPEYVKAWVEEVVSRTVDQFTDAPEPLPYTTRSTGAAGHATSIST